MNDVSELERRILFALERIGSGLDGLDSAGSAPKPNHPLAGVDDAEMVASLRAELEAERTANAQLTERVRAIKDKQETMVSALENKVLRLTQQLEAAGADLERQRKMTADLTGVTRELTEAAQAGVVAPELVNQSLLVELAALRAARANEMAEMEEILADLKPLIGEVA